MMKDRQGKRQGPGGRGAPRPQARGFGKRSDADRVWLFGLHAVRDALTNPRRKKHRLITTLNAADKLAEALEGSGLSPEIADARRFNAPLDPQSVHQGAALEVSPLDWPTLEDFGPSARRLVFLDRVTDPHNVGAILRTAEVFAADAVIAPYRHAAPETGALAKSASGALERQPYLRVKNLVAAIEVAKSMGFEVLGLAGEAGIALPEHLEAGPAKPRAIVLGAEGPGLRPSTRAACDVLVAIPSAQEFSSLNVSNAAAVAMFALSQSDSKLSDSS